MRTPGDLPRTIVVATDPVCGMQVDEARAVDAGRVSSHGGERYFFCNPRCKTRFDADPAAVLRGDRTAAEDAGGAAPAAPTVREYVCPMHPEIVRDEPGSCPICGMALEPRDRRRARGGDEPRARSTCSDASWVSGALSVPILALAMGDMLPGASAARALGPRLARWLQLALATPVVLWGGCAVLRARLAIGRAPAARTCSR